MAAKRFRWFFFVFFLFSGFCGLVYEVVWTRLAMADFGVTTTVVSVVLSVFMVGLALGSWLAGWRPLLAWLSTGRRFLRGYALVELVIGAGAFMAPWLMDQGRALLLWTGESDSVRYHVFSGLFITVALLPWATLMGATFALALGALRTVTPESVGEFSSGRCGFSFLYLANVLGAACGTLITAAVLVEAYGFRGTLRFAALANALIALGAWGLAKAAPFASGVPWSREQPAAATGDREPIAGSSAMLAVLFATGFASMGMELVWTRMFTFYLGTFVYAFAVLLFVYLLATYVGTLVYRWRAAKGLSTHAEYVWALLGVLGVLPLLYADTRFIPHHGSFDLSPWLVLAVAPLCAALGYITPLLVDRYGARDVGRASRGYAVNVLGCILGPLVAGYVLLPFLGERSSLLVLAVILLVIGAGATASVWQRQGAKRHGVAVAFAANVVLMWGIAAAARTYVEAIPNRVVLRDHTATVVAFGDGMRKGLLVNGVGITILTPITKTMAHFPLAHLPGRPRSALAICFGMGTTFRSLASWGISVTGVDLVPSVPALFGYFHPDAGRVLAAGNAHIVIDDGRRFLDRTDQQFDVVTVDPPPPVQAAGSSLLYSREFYRSVKRRLSPHGILAQWTPRTEPTLLSPMVRALLAEFKYVRAFVSLEGWGYHFLASDEPIPHLSGAELAARLPPAALADLTEWTPGVAPADVLGTMVAHERDPRSLTASPVNIPTLTDDHPSNEYFAMRLLRHGVP